MRARAVVISLLIATLVVPGVIGWSTAEVTQPTQSTQIQIDPIPPHRLMAAPIDAAIFDKPTVVIKQTVVHKKAVHKKVVVKTTASWTQGNWGRFPASVQRSALCIAHHESWTLHNGRRLWNALNLAGSSASGFAQWIDSSWRTQARRAGVGTKYSRAYLAPPAIQAEVFAYQAMHYGLYPWKGTNCPGT